MDRIVLLKWIDEEGRTQRFRLLKEICSKWKLIGDLIGCSNGDLEAIKEEHRGSPYDCCREVFCKWLQQEEGNYCRTWNGLCDLLEDIELCTLAETVRNIVKS